MSGNVTMHICLMLSVYKSFHQTVKHGRQRSHILQDLTGLEIKISMKASKACFQQPKSDLQKSRY